MGKEEGSMNFLQFAEARYIIMMSGQALQGFPLPELGGLPTISTTVQGYQMKTCKCCKLEKQSDEFHKKSDTRDGLHIYCKKCRKSQEQERYIGKRETIKARVSKYRNENRDKANAAVKSAHDKDPHRKENNRIRGHNRRMLVRLSGGKLSKGITKKLHTLQKGKCPVCKCNLVKYHLDHIIPLALGGKHQDSNIQLLCPQCNLKKNSKHPIDFMQSNGYLI